ncbi:MAG: hypothetical protein HPY78_03490 [Brevinematales bacterium]|nr:hypothetical protein [Brevinematales bacterium]
MTRKEKRELLEIKFKTLVEEYLMLLDGYLKRDSIAERLLRTRNATRMFLETLNDVYRDETSTGEETMDEKSAWHLLVEQIRQRAEKNWEKEEEDGQGED